MTTKVQTTKTQETKTATTSSAIKTPVHHPEWHDPFLQMQQTMGNQAVQDLFRAEHAPFIPVANRTDSPVIQRHDAMRHYRGCNTADENFFVEQAQVRAPAWVAMTIADLTALLSPHEGVPHIESVLNRFFPPPAGRSGRIGGRHRPETVRQIISHLESMHQTLLNQRSFRCVTRETCARETLGHNPDAYAYAGFRTEISICPNFFTLSPNQQLSTLVHESAHQIGLMRNVIAREEVMQLDLRAALRNAESHALLVEESVGGSPVAAGESESTYAVEGEAGGWNPSFAHCELFLEEPVESTFCQQAPDCRLLSSFQTGLENPFETPFPSEEPIRFRGGFRFFVDTSGMPIPQGRPLPTAQIRILFTAEGGRQRILMDQTEENPEYPAGFPGNPLEFSAATAFSPFFDFTLTENGRLQFTCSLVDYELPDEEAIAAMYEETIRVTARHDI